MNFKYAASHHVAAEDLSDAARNSQRGVYPRSCSFRSMTPLSNSSLPRPSRCSVIKTSPAASRTLHVRLLYADEARLRLAEGDLTAVHRRGDLERTGELSLHLNVCSRQLVAFEERLRRGLEIKPLPSHSRVIF